MSIKMPPFQAWYKTHVGPYQGGTLHGLESEQLGGLRPQGMEESESGKVVKVAQDGSWEGDGWPQKYAG